MYQRMVSRRDPWLEMKSIELWQGDYRVFNDLNLQLRKGENVVILGPNGSGKSSLIKLISRELYPVIKDGSYFKLFGKTSIDLINTRKRIGILTKDIESRTPSNMLVSNIVLSGFTGSIGINKRKHLNQNKYDSVSLLLKMMDLDKVASKKFVELSDGQKRRVLLARSIINNPEIIILDEPTITLDLYAKYKLIRILINLSEKNSNLVLVTHQIENINRVINRVILLKDGVIIADDIPDKIMRSDIISDLFETPLTIIRNKNHWNAIPSY